jgi:hypothetical protein
MTESAARTEGDGDHVNEWTIVRCGLAGVYVMAAICFVKFLAAIPRLFTGDWTWTELALFPLQVIVLGFFPGLVTGMSLPLRHYGHLGHAIIGAGCANVYLLACFALFEFDGLLNARLVTVLAFAAIASFGGGAMGVVIAQDIQQDDRQIPTSEQETDG